LATHRNVAGGGLPEQRADGIGRAGPHAGESGLGALGPATGWATTAPGGSRASLVKELRYALGSVGGVFVEPPQHWDRRRWFVPCGLSSARSLRKLYDDGGRACEYLYRPFANPGEEVSWRMGARILASSKTSPEEALKEAAERTRQAIDGALKDLALLGAQGAPP